MIFSTQGGHANNYTNEVKFLKGSELKYLNKMLNTGLCNLIQTLVLSQK